MEAFGDILSDPLLLASLALPASAALLFLLLWLGCRRRLSAGGYRQAADELRRLNREQAADVEARDQELDTLRQQVAVLESRQYLDNFSVGGRWTLVVGVPVTIDGESHTLGLARTAGGDTQPFLTRQTLDGVKAEGLFQADAQRLVPVTESRAAAAAPSPAAAAGGDAEMTLFLRPGASRDPNEGMPFLKVETGVNQGERLLVNWTRTTMGRAASNPITLGDTEASRVHAEIRFDGRQFHLRDNNSTNGTWLNGQPLSESVLKLGDRIRVGTSEMVFTCDGMEQMRDAPPRAIAAFEAMLRKAPEYLDAVRQLAFLLERDIKRNGEADAMWKRLAELEKRAR